ncbi:T-box-containing protein TBX6L-like [Genypterus blacodes]|uniref:T-box-containing protein TBX6L-like n=1 Tax=Genypterus blacodes TaxID=154954 RepID=UPI003F7757A4
MQHITDSKPAADSYQQGSIRMNLVNSDLWKSFHSVGTEMIITKHGRRMFPHCSVSLSGLQPFNNYVVMVDMVPADSFKYKWKAEQWEAAGISEPQPPCRTYMHPDSPAVGSHWMKQPLSFLKLKLTNNTLDQHGHIIVHSMHRYYPRFHVIQADNPYTVRWGHFQTFSFPETTFTTVTAYQNPKITKLKIDHNPFAKGFREGGTHSQGKRCRSNLSPPAKRAALDRKAQSRSPAGLQRMQTAFQPAETKESQSVGEGSQKGGHFAPWSLEQQDPVESLHVEPLELHEYDYSSEEQMVPASMAAQQAYRPVDYSRFPYPSNEADMAHALGHHAPHPYPPAEHCTQQQQRAYHQQQYHGNTADWSQYPLFSYSCW